MTIKYRTTQFLARGVIYSRSASCVVQRLQGRAASVEKPAQEDSVCDESYYPSGTLKLSERDSRTFLESLENPRQPSEKLISLFHS